MNVSHEYTSQCNHNTKTRAWASCQIRKIAGCTCAKNAGNVFPRRRLQRKPLVSDPGMHHGTCVTHVSWCMSGSLTHGGEETFPAFPAHAHPQFYVSGKRPMYHQLCVFLQTHRFILYDLTAVSYKWYFALIYYVRIRTGNDLTIKFPVNKRSIYLNNGNPYWNHIGTDLEQMRYTVFFWNFVGFVNTVVFNC